MFGITTLKLFEKGTLTLLGRVILGLIMSRTSPVSAKTLIKSAPEGYSVFLSDIEKEHKIVDYATRYLITQHYTTSQANDIVSIICMDLFNDNRICPHTNVRAGIKRNDVVYRYPIRPATTLRVQHYLRDLQRIFSSLKSIDLSDFQLNYVPGDALYIFNNLGILNLNRTGVKSEELACLTRKIDDVEELSLDGNGLTKFPYLGFVRRLKKLSISHNNFGKLDFTNMAMDPSKPNETKKHTNIVNLNLSNCKITHLENINEIFPDLEKINLTHNELLSSPTCLTNYKRMIEVDIIGNPLRPLDEYNYNTLSFLLDRRYIMHYRY